MYVQDLHPSDSECGLMWAAITYREVAVSTRGRAVTMFFCIPSSVTGCKQSVTDCLQPVTEPGMTLQPLYSH